jgi:hypothetical protein
LPPIEREEKRVYHMSLRADELQQSPTSSQMRE